MKELYQIWKDLRCSGETDLSFKDWIIQHKNLRDIFCDDYDDTDDDFIIDESESIYL